MTTATGSETRRHSRVAESGQSATVWPAAAQTGRAQADIIVIMKLKADIKMMRTIARAPYFTSMLLLGLALFTALLFITEIWFLLMDTPMVSHSTLALAYAALSGVLPLWGIHRDRRD